MPTYILEKFVDFCVFAMPESEEKCLRNVGLHGKSNKDEAMRGDRGTERVRETGICHVERTSEMQINKQINLCC